MSNWLTGIIVLLIIVILADGLRRTYNLRRHSIHLSPKMKKRAKETVNEVEGVSLESLKSELPNGGARVIGYRSPNELRQPRKKISAKELREARRREEAAKRTPEQTRLNLNESVPILMESVEPQSTLSQKTPQQNNFFDSANERIEPSFSKTLLHEKDFEPELPHSQANKHDDNIAYEEDDDYENEVDDYDEDLDDEDLDENDSDEELLDEDADDFEDELDDEDESDDAPKAASPASLEPQEVIIINVMAFKGESFNGNDLLDVILKCGLRYGSMDIFHRYSDTKGEGVLLFSMANMVKPGTFDLDLMDEFETPGVSLFMTLPIDADSIQSFELMVNTANTIADTLDGELKDEQRSAMTRQTIEHCRQRISDFERKKLFRRPR